MALKTRRRIPRVPPIRPTVTQTEAGALVVTPPPAPQLNATPLDITAISDPLMAPTVPTTPAPGTLSGWQPRMQGSECLDPYLPSIAPLSRQLMVWTAAAAKLSYVSTSGVLNAFRDAVHADAVTYIASPGGDAPAGIRIDYPNHVCFAIQGTTTQAQVNSYRNADSRIVVASNSSNAFTTQSEMLSFLATPNNTFGGLVYYPFLKWAQHWAPTIAAHMYGAGVGKQLVLTGHSAGAAIVETITNFCSGAFRYLETYSAISNQRATVQQTLPGDIASIGETVYGSVFGQPLTMQPFMLAADALVAGVPVLSRSMWAPTAISRRIMNITHPYDPIALLPARAVNTVGSWFSGLPEIRTLLQRNTLYCRSLMDHWPLSLPARPGELGGFPLTRADFDARCNRYHQVDYYLAEARGTAQLGPGKDAYSDEWAAMLQAALSANLTDQLSNW